jgi:hypothetical protein
MRSQPTPQIPDIKADKRFDALVKQQMQEHEHLISCHNKEMQSLRDSLKIAMDRFDSLLERYEADLKDIALNFNEQILFLKQKVTANEMQISDQKQTILSLYQQLHDLHLYYARKSDVEKLRKDLEIRIDELTKNHLTSFQNHEKEVKESLRELGNDLNKFKTHFVEKVTKIDEDVENKFSQTKLDKEGIQREFIVYKKDVFYIEKKIENIYTLIERINKRDGLCRKQE